MTSRMSLPARPSLESIRKRAKRLARDAAAGRAEAIARARAQVSNVPLPLSHRDALLVVAREYGFPGWQDLRDEVARRTSSGLDWAAVQAERAIHDNDVARLRGLLAAHPALLAWRGDHGETLLSAATSAFADTGSPEREGTYTRPACAELLLDAGAVVDPGLWESVIGSRAKGLLHLLWRKGALPPTLAVHAARGDREAVRAALDGVGDDLAAVEQAFDAACRFGQHAVASLLLDRCVALDPELGRRIDGWRDRDAFIGYLAGHPQRFGSPWWCLVMNEVLAAIQGDDPATVTRWLECEPFLLGAAAIPLQVEMIERATWNDRGPMIEHLFGFGPAILYAAPPPRSAAIVFALEYGKAHLVPLLTRVWPLPDDLPHAAGTGDLARVQRWFDAAGRPALGDPDRHYPVNDPDKRADLRWGGGTVQQVLDVALAWACLNGQFEIARFLLAHGADINTDWSTHEPASILHEAAIQENFPAARFLIEQGIDTTIRDHRWNATAAGWAFNATQNAAMAGFLAAHQPDDPPG